jgi:hypothetical protein
MTPALPRIEAKHPGETPRGFRLRDAFHIGAKANGIAALVARSEVRPAAGAQVYFERTGTPINATYSPPMIRPLLF